LAIPLVALSISAQVEKKSAWNRHSPDRSKESASQNTNHLSRFAFGLRLIFQQRECFPVSGSRGAARYKKDFLGGAATSSFGE
jgi:hypothetical protein